MTGKCASVFRKHKVHLVNRLKFLSDGKDGLDVVVTQFLNQMGDGGVVLSKNTHIFINNKRIQVLFQIQD